MLNIDYSITLQDDLDADVTFLEYSFNRPWVKWLVVRGGTCFLILFGLYLLIAGIINPSDPDATLSIFLGSGMILLGIIYFLVMHFPAWPRLRGLRNRDIAQRWKNQNPEQTRGITITETEFIFTTEYSEMAWTRKCLTQFHEGQKGFILWFHKDGQKYIPKKIFANGDEMIRFRNMLQQDI